MKTPDEHETLLALSAQIKNGIEKGVATPNGKIIESMKKASASYSQVSKALCNKENATLDEVLQAVRQVKNQLQAYEESAIKCCYESRCNKEINALYECCNRLEKELEAVKRERDALLFDLSCRTDACAVCEHGRFRKNDCKELFDDYGCAFEWRGVCPENTEVQEDE